MSEAVLCCRLEPQAYCTHFPPCLSCSWCLRPTTPMATLGKRFTTTSARDVDDAHEAARARDDDGALCRAREHGEEGGARAERDRRERAHRARVVDLDERVGEGAALPGAARELCVMCYGEGRGTHRSPSPIV